MDITTPPPPYSLEDRKSTTFAEVSRSTQGIPSFKEVLVAFSEFIAAQEAVTLSKNQLELFRGLSALVLETCVISTKNGGDVSEILSTCTKLVFAAPRPALPYITIH
ncbi:hypothetical protein FS749_004076 [Ceratobasidium sp. UAMH 11750]|nr:hypothetical protein FS749_004076 [Ceratobasidium sp. UAMH 11750]